MILLIIEDHKAIIILNLIAFTKYDIIGPSSRLRLFQFVTYLRSVEINVQINPLVRNVYLQRLFNTGQRSYLELLRGYIHRSSVLVKSVHHYDLMWIEKELWPWLPAVAECWLAKKKPYVVDYDDAVFHLYDHHNNRIVRAFLSRKIDTIMRNAKLVMAGNKYLADHAIKAGARRVEIIPTVVNFERYAKAVPKKSLEFIIGWIGTPITEKYLNIIRGALKVLLRDGDSRIVLVGASKNAILGLPRDVIKWSETSEVKIIQSFDVGIMPLEDNHFEKGKCGYKLIQCMACGIPVVASPVGVNQTIVDHGINGFLARTEADWVHYLKLLKHDEKLCVELGKNARLKVKKNFSLSKAAPILCELLFEAAGF